MVEKGEMDAPIPYVPGDPCPDCKGMQFMVRDVPVGHEHFGKLFPCPLCGRKRRAAYLERICGLTGEMSGWTFENTRRLSWNADAYDTARAAASVPRWFFTLTGPSGRGKTRLLACIVNAGRAAGLLSVYTTTSGLLSTLREALSPEAGASFDEQWKRFTTAPILAVDEVDRWHSTSWAEERFFDLVDIRYRRGAEMLTCFAANAQPKEAAEYVASRVSDARCRHFHLAGIDLRQVAGEDG